MLLSRLHFSSELTSCGHWWLVWGKWNVTWHFISTQLKPHCLSAVETLIEGLHEAWDVQSCLFTLKLVVQKTEWLRSLALCSAQVCGASRLRHGNRSWSRPLESMLVLGLYQHVSEPSSGSPRRLYSDLSCHIKDCQNTSYYLNFLKKKTNKPVFVRYTCVPNRKTRTETIRYEYVYRYTPNIYTYILYIYIYYLNATLLYIYIYIYQSGI